jgi:hypothetical protein
MKNKVKNSNNGGNWIGVGTAIGAAVFAATNEPVWIATEKNDVIKFINKLEL